MITREALDKVRDEWSLDYSGYDPKGKREGLNLIALDQCVGARKGFTAALDLLWPVIEASAKMSADIEEKCPTWETEGDDCSAVQVYRNLKKALSELKERVK